MVQETLTRTTIRDKLARYIANEILHDPLRGIEANEPLISSGLIDSFHLVDLALFTEDTFSVRIEDSELAASVFDTVNQLVDLIFRRWSGRSA